MIDRLATAADRKLGGPSWQKQAECEQPAKFHAPHEAGSHPKYRLRRLRNSRNLQRIDCFFCSQTVAEDSCRGKRKQATSPVKDVACCESKMLERRTRSQILVSIESRSDEYDSYESSSRTLSSSFLVAMMPAGAGMLRPSNSIPTYPLYPASMTIFIIFR